MCYVRRRIWIFVYTIDPDGHATKFSTAFLDTRANSVMLNSILHCLPLMQPLQHEPQHVCPKGGKFTAIKMKSKFHHPTIKQKSSVLTFKCCPLLHIQTIHFPQIYLLHFPFSPAHIYQTNERVVTGYLQNRKYSAFPLIDVASLTSLCIFPSFIVSRIFKFVMIISYSLEIFSDKSNTNALT